MIFRILSCLIMLIASIGCLSKTSMKLINGEDTQVEVCDLKTTVCIMNDIDWLHEIAEQKMMYYVNDTDFGYDHLDYRLLDSSSFEKLYADMREFNTSKCFSTKKQVYDFFGKNKVELKDKATAEKLTMYNLFFINRDDPTTHGLIKGVHTQFYFNQDGSRKFAASFYIEAIQ